MSSKPATGCEHYVRSCEIKAPCCGKYFSCHHCHDHQEDHALDRSTVQLVLCLRCDETDQPIASNCRNCGKEFAPYACTDCALFCDLENVFHCEYCGICRRGTRDTIEHCHTCNSCVVKDTLPFHKCRPNALHDDCPICLSYMYYSREPVVHLPCTHVIHAACLKALLKYRPRCPICAKAISGLKECYEGDTNSGKLASSLWS